MLKSSQVTPFYGLYGDQFTHSEPGFVHIEELAVRSKDLDWIIKPHRHNRLFQIICIFNGSAEITINQNTHHLEGDWAITLPIGTVHGFRFQPNSQGFVLSITDSVLTEEIQQGLGGNRCELLHTPQLINLMTNDPQFHQFTHYIAQIREERSCHYSDQTQSLALLSRLAVLSLNRQLQHKKLQSQMGLKESSTLSKFRNLIEAHYKEHWTVSAYATALHLSTATLNRLSNQYLGHGPKILIQDRLLTEAKRQLIYTQQSLEEIAYSLGFKDYPYFARFFKKLENTTPGAYRKSADERILP